MDIPIFDCFTKVIIPVNNTTKTLKLLIAEEQSEWSNEQLANFFYDSVGKELISSL
ncbi:MAG: hypothetical protein FWG33_05190 [Oscillospiraceae bacterium]|nr:hypothetical protein [Oscillospiraceae bacterium]